MRGIALAGEQQAPESIVVDAAPDEKTHRSDEHEDGTPFVRSPARCRGSIRRGKRGSGKTGKQNDVYLLVVDEQRKTDTASHRQRHRFASGRQEREEGGAQD